MKDTIAFIIAVCIVIAQLLILAIVGCFVIALLATGYSIGVACSWWDRKQPVKKMHQQRKPFEVSQHMSPPARRIQSARRAFAMARVFGRSVPVALCLGARMMATGSTGQYRIKV